MTGASGYRVYRKLGNSGWSRIGTVNGGSSTAYTDKTVASDTHYVYTIRAYFGDIRSGYDPIGVEIILYLIPMWQFWNLSLMRQDEEDIQWYVYSNV